jgi:hypothetical protein
LGLTVHTKMEGLPAAQEHALRSLAATIHTALEQLALEQQIPTVEVTVVVARELTSEVRAILRQLDGDSAQFATERISGVVVGKCIALNDDFSKQVVVLDGTAWIDANPAAQAQFIASLAHELAHVVIDRARHASGALDGVPATPTTAWTSRATLPGLRPPSSALTWSPTRCFAWSPAPATATVPPAR